MATTAPTLRRIRSSVGRKPEIDPEDSERARGKERLGTEQQIAHEETCRNPRTREHDTARLPNKIVAFAMSTTSST